MAILANKENEAGFRVPKTPSKSTVPPGFMKTPIGSKKKSISNNENFLQQSVKKVGGGTITPLQLGSRTVLGGKTNVYKSGVLSNNFKSKQFNSTFKPTATTTTENKTATANKKDVVIDEDKYDMEIEFIPAKVSPLPYRPLDEIELDYEQLGRACRGRGQIVNFDDSLDKPLAEFIADISAPDEEEHDHLKDEMDFLVKSSPLNLTQGNVTPLPGLATVSMTTSVTQHKLSPLDNAKRRTTAAVVTRQLKRKPSNSLQQNNAISHHNKKLVVQKPAIDAAPISKEHIMVNRKIINNTTKTENSSGSNHKGKTNTNHSKARFMEPTISAAAKVKKALPVNHTTARDSWKPFKIPYFSSSRSSDSGKITSSVRARPNAQINIFNYKNHQEYISPTRAMVQTDVTVPESPYSDFDFENQVDLPTLDLEIEALEKDLL